MQKGSKVRVINQSIQDFDAFIYSSDDLYETAYVVLEMPESDGGEVTTMSFSYADIVVV